MQRACFGQCQYRQWQSSLCVFADIDNTGIVTVQYNRFAFPEFCGYGKYGFIVDKPTPTDVAKSIIEAYSDPERLETMGKEGQEYVLNRFTWENVTKSMLNVIRNDLEGLDE